MDKDKPQPEEEPRSALSDLLDSGRTGSELPDVPEWDYKRPEETKKHLETPDMAGWRMGGVGLTAAYAVLGCVLAGFGLGWLLDAGGDGVIWRGVLTLVGAVLGLAAAIWMILREQARSGE